MSVVAEKKFGASTIFGQEPFRFIEKESDFASKLVIAAIIALVEKKDISFGELSSNEKAKYLLWAVKYHDSYGLRLRGIASVEEACNAMETMAATLSEIPYADAYVYEMVVKGKYYTRDGTPHEAKKHQENAPSYEDYMRGREKSSKSR